MKATVFFSSTVAILFSSLLFLAGCQGTPQPASTSAFVYVLSFPNQTLQLNAFSADSNGQLTPVPGSPFPMHMGSLVASRHYLFGSDGSSIFSFAIASNGALTQVSSINGLQSNPLGTVGNLFLDRTGTSLYAVHYRIDGANEGYESFSLDDSTGALTHLGTTPSGCCGTQPLKFTGDNLYGYYVYGYHFDCELVAFKRNDDGSLTSFFSDGFDASPDPSRPCPAWVAAAPTSNLAVSFVAAVGATRPQGAGAVLAAFAVDSSGVLTTTSTVANMPQTAVGGYIVMSPSGKFLAAGGLGLEIFHFNEADPITPFTGLLTQDLVYPMAWDNDNHLYAITQQDQSIHTLSVFNVTATGASQAPGSPYTITNPLGLVVVPRM